jgi:hypothetical protein
MAQVLSQPLKLLLKLLVKDGHGYPITSRCHAPLVLGDMIMRAPEPGSITHVAVEVRKTMMRLSFRLPTQFSLLFR